MSALTSIAVIATKISLLLTLGIVYPVMLLADAFDWPVGVQVGLGVTGLVTLVGTRVALTDWQEWRADRARLRHERLVRRSRT